MLNRRRFLGTLSSAVATLAFGLPQECSGSAPALATCRPAPSRRTFTSPAVEARLSEVKRAIRDPELAWMFENCFPNTLDTTVHFRDEKGLPDTYVITGDIPAMWLRDSSAQMWPYLPYARQDGGLARMLAGLVRRHARCILLDPYANAFLMDASAVSPHKDDQTDMRPGVWERKWEVDSLAYAMRLAHGYWKATGDASPFDATWQRAMQLAVETLRVQQRRKGDGPYRFERHTTSPTETLWRGLGYPTRPVGLIHTGFRPSDDAGVYPFLIPSNFLAVRGLRGIAEVLDEACRDAPGAAEARALADDVAAALASHAVGPRGIFAFEIDGLGNHLYMDDANVPNLLSLPYLGCCRADDEVYRRTRAFTLGPDNPYYFQGAVTAGIGSPHTGMGRIWPMSLIMTALTSTEDAEIARCLAGLKATHAGTGFMHEAFDAGNPSKYSRPWFSWANSMFGELIVRLYVERRHLLGA